MNNPVYINGIGYISPQDTFEANNNKIQTAEQGFFDCIEPSYKMFLDRKQLRRMSRIVKMGLTASDGALTDAGSPSIDAIVTGSAWGCVGDTEVFLETLIQNQEDYLTPTAFVQSTHNTVGGQIALRNGLNCYNMTYVQGALSFESALMDAQLKIMENNAPFNCLLGGIDVLTEKLKILMRRLTCASTNKPMGEGSSFFVLSDQLSINTYAKITGVYFQYNGLIKQDNASFLSDSLKQSDINPDQINLILGTGLDKAIRDSMFPYSCFLNIDTLCGKYPTASAFAMALGAQILKGCCPLDLKLDLGPKPIDKILIYTSSIHCRSAIILSRI